MAFKKIYFLIASIVILLFGTGYILIRPYYVFLTDTLDISPFEAVFSKNSVKTIEDSVNILILGIAGGTHDGPNLTDSIIVVHYNFKTNRLLIIGIPRDIWSETLKDKINTAYAYGEAKQEGGGLKLAKAEIGAVLGIPIQYSMVINFNKFRELIDYLGGIDVNIENSFTDTQFPIEGKENDLCGDDPEYRCRYEILTFKTGLTHMNGETALKFVRSRHAEGKEGSDFARNKRQQLVIGAIKENVINIVKSNNLNALKGLYIKTDALLNRDVTNQQILSIMKNMLLEKKYSLSSIFLTEDLFMVPNYDDYGGKYVLVPRVGNFTEIYSYISCLIENLDEKKCLSLIEKREENK